MKILFIHTYYRDTGGEDTVFESEIDLLKRNGIEVEKLTFNNRNLGVLKFLVAPFNLHSYLKVRKKLRKFKPDIVHLHNFHFGASPAIIAAIKNNNYPLVHTVHNYRLVCPSGTLYYKKKIFLSSLMENFPWTAIRKGVYRNSMLATFWVTVSIRFFNLLYGWRKVDKFIALCDQTKEIFLKSYLKLNEEQVEVKTNFAEDFNLPDEERGNHFLYVGRLTEEKGIPVMLKAFSQSNHELIIAGDGPLRQEVEEAAQTNENIKYIGFRSHDEIQKELKRCASLIFPSIWYECAPMTLIEAYASKTPIIASNIGVMLSMIIDKVTGLHFEAGNAEDLIKKLGYWQSLSREEKNNYYANARCFYEKNHTPEKNLEKMTNIYSGLINKQKTQTRLYRYNGSTNMPRILISGLFIYPAKVGGAEQYFYNLLTGFCENNAQDRITLVLNSKYQNEFSKIVDQFEIEWIPCKRNRAYYDYWLLNYIKDPQRYGTIFNPNYVTPLHVQKRKKYVTTIHDLNYLHFAEFFSKKKRLFQYISHLNTLKFADKVICISDFVKDDILKRFGSKYADKLVTIHNPVDFERLEHAGDGAYDFKYILCVSALFPHKNTLTLVKAFEEFQRRTGSNLKLVLVGQNVGLHGGNFAPYQQNLVEVSSKNESIIYTGFISDKKLGQLYQHCEFFVLPSLFEGFGFPVIEALGFGKPVVTTRCGSLAEVSLNHAIYVDDPKNYMELAEKMIYVSSRIGELNQYYVSKAEKFRKEYNVKRLAKSYLEALEFE